MKSAAVLMLLPALFFAASLTAAEDATAFGPDDAALLERCLAAAEASAPDGDPAACIGVAASACQERPEGFSTRGIVDCLNGEAEWWDQRLNAGYATLRATLDAERAASLRDAQRAWIAFRDAECAFRFDYWREGTIRSIFFADCMLDTTARRALHLDAVAEWIQ